MSQARTGQRDERPDETTDETVMDVTERGAAGGMTWEIAQVSRVDPPQAAQAGGPLAPLIEARLDLGRAARKGIPEVVLAESKRDDQLVAIVRAFLESSGYVIVSRARPGQLEMLARETPAATMDMRELARAAALHAPGYERPRTGGHIGILTAGAGDVPIAEEARLVAEEMGCRVTSIYDVGVAGIHRLFGPLSDLLASDVSAIVVCAGMDGALPSVVAGLAHIPVIGCPTSIGYGAGGKGRAALLAMLQTCAPGMTVVNIDNGVGAGSTAALIANQLATRAASKSE
ncbi:MAG TPA: nickel pincer cofactor biosynthesis protein LarB [Ktedonobacterales bacterium]|nr:nickel pincer cofactor biosynthesis protein LarB [Ktedonobacterales bacterium]